MKKVLITAVVSMFMLLSVGKIETKAETTILPMKATAYCLKGQMSDSTYTRLGVCAGKKEWLGKTVAVYLNIGGTIGNFLGYYDVCDTGGEAIRTGKVLDIWLPTKAECAAFGNQDVFVVVVD